MVAAKLRPMFDGEAKERQKRKPDSVVEKVPPQNKKARDAAGEALNVSSTSSIKSGCERQIAELRHPELFPRLA